MTKNCCIILEDEISAARLISGYIKNSLNISVILINKRKLLKSYFKSINVDILYLNKFSEKKILSFLKKKKIRFITINLNNILSSNFFKKFKGKIFSVHGGILPKYKGRFMLKWMLVDKLKKIGSSLILVDKKIDSGKIFKTIKFKVKYPTNFNTLLFEMHYKTRIPLYDLIPEIINNKKKVNFKKFKKKYTPQLAMHDKIFSLIDLQLNKKY
jgi:methionyl-tRNA formyltransferase